MKHPTGILVQGPPWHLLDMPKLPCKAFDPWAFHPPCPLLLPPLCFHCLRFFLSRDAFIILKIMRHSKSEWHSQTLCVSFPNYLSSYLSSHAHTNTPGLELELPNSSPCRQSPQVLPCCSSLKNQHLPLILCLFFLILFLVPNC